MPLNASRIQQMILDSLRSSKGLTKEPDSFLDRLLAGHEYDAEALSRATAAVYKQAYYTFARDLDVDPTEQRKLLQLARLLRLDDEQRTKHHYEVGLAIYRKHFREASADGDLSQSEQDDLDSIATTFALHNRHIRQAIAKDALAHYSFVLANSLKDGVLSTEEMAELELIAKRFGLTSKELSQISIPDKKEILRAALVTIKANEGIGEDDRAYIRSLCHYLNAPELLTPCMMDLDLYQNLHAIRRGELPTLDPGNLLLDQAEKLHYRADVTYETCSGGKTRRTKGTLYVGTFRMRLIGHQRSHEIRYGNIFEVNYVQQRSPKIDIVMSSGKGTGAYRLSKQNSPAALLELREIITFLIKKSRRMIEASGLAPRQIPAEVRSEVWHRDGGACVLCGARAYLEFDHVIPRSKGGDTSVGNLQLLCRKCNSEKSDRI